MLGTMKVIARGGKALYGAPLGILMLEAKFPRIPGDMGNATTWPFPVLYRVVRGATPERVVLHAAAGPSGADEAGAWNPGRDQEDVAVGGREEQEASREPRPLSVVG